MQEGAPRIRCVSNFANAGLHPLGVIACPDALVAFVMVGNHQHHNVRESAAQHPGQFGRRGGREARQEAVFQVADGDNLAGEPFRVTGSRSASKRLVLVPLRRYARMRAILEGGSVVELLSDWQRFTSGVVVFFMSDHLARMTGGAASQELGKVADAVLHQAADLEVRQVVAASGAPDGQGGRLHFENFGCLFVADGNGRVLRVKAELLSDLLGNLCLERGKVYGVGFGHVNSPVWIESAGLCLE